MPHATGRRIQLTYQGQTKTIGEWSEETGLPLTALFGRFYRKWNTELILTAPVGGKRPAKHRIPRIDPSLPWAEDKAAQALVREHPNGMTLDEVGLALGVTRERVRQIEHAAVSKLRRAALRQLGERADAMRLLRES